MDARGVKRPRSTTPTKGDSTPAPPPSKKKKDKSSSSKKSKKNKKNKDKGGETSKSSSADKPSQQNKSSLDSTATAQGQMMAQMLSTFSKAEQARFEAFRRATIPNQAVQEWLAANLVHRYRHDEGVGPPQQPKLSDLVEPGSATSIGIVASTLAKVYAQRLVSAAKQVAALEEGADQEPLRPHHVMEAWTSRQQQGLDPGFFLQPNPAVSRFTMTEANFEQRRLAALAAQDAHDAYVESKKNSTEKDDKEGSGDSQQNEPTAQASDEAKTTAMDTS